MNDIDPIYVVNEETRRYRVEKIEKTINLVIRAPRLTDTNPDLTGPVESGVVLPCEQQLEPIEYRRESRLVYGDCGSPRSRPRPVHGHVFLDTFGWTPGTFTVTIALTL